MAAVTGLTLVKRFPYRGDDTEEFSNTYHFKGLPPGDDPSWTVLMNDVIAREKKVLSTATFYTRVYGYNSDDPGAHHVFVHDYATDPNPPQGTMAVGTRTMSGDQAACVEWRTNRLSAKGKPIWLRKYFHGGTLNVTDPDGLDPAFFPILDAFAGSGADGIQAVHGGLRSPSSDDTVTGHKVIGWVTTRTLKRRGKRPRTGS